MSYESEGIDEGGLGFAGMLGGVLFVGIYVGLTAFGGNNYGTAFTFYVASAVPILLFAIATVGLYRSHGDEFGLLGRAGTVVILVGFALSILNSSWLLVTRDHLLPEVLQLGYILIETLGALVLGAAVVRARKLPHALSGGLLLALGLPISLSLWYGVVVQVGLESTLLASALYTIPFGAGWLLLGYDLVTASGRDAHVSA